MRGRFRRRARLEAIERQGQRLAGDAEAYLAGTILSHFESRAGDPPKWAWLNAPAHGDPATLAMVVHEDAPDPRTAHSEWRAARREIAAELLNATAGDDSALRRVQQVALIPLEEALMEPERCPPLGADGLSAAARNAVRAALS